MRRLMPFTALKLRAALFAKASSSVRVVRRLMPFTALKLYRTFMIINILYFVCCAPPNAVYGIET